MKSVQKIFLVWLTLVVASGCSHSSMNKGKEAMARKDYPKAIEFFTQAVKEEPGNSKARYSLVEAYSGLIMEKKGKGQLSSESLTQLLSSIEEVLAPYASDSSFKDNLSYLHSLLGDMYSSNFQMEEALKEWKKALELNPEFPEVHFNLGVYYNGKNQLEEASEEFEKALMANNYFLNAYNALGNVYMRMGENQKAVETLSKALEINPDYVQARYGLGLAYHRIGKNQEAIDQYKKILENNTDYPIVYQALRNSYLDLGMMKEAEEADAKWKSFTKGKDFVPGEE